MCLPLREALIRVLLAIPFVLALVSPLPAYAQGEAASDATPGPRIWAGGGGGLSTTGTTWFISGSAGFLDTHLISARVLNSAERRGERFLTVRPLEYTWEAGVLYGQPMVSGDRLTVTASAGVGLVGGLRRGDFWYTDEADPGSFKSFLPLRPSVDVYARDRFQAVSLPMEVRLHMRPTHLFGVDILLFGTVNHIDPYGGVAVQVRLGGVR